MDEIIRLLLSMGKTKEEIAEFIGKEMPTGGINKTTNIIKPITKKVAGDYPLIGSRITDPTQTGQYGRYNIQALDPKDRYSLIRQSNDDQKLNWEKTIKFIRDGGYKLSDLQKQNLTYNLGVLQRSKVVLKDIEKGLINEGQNVEELYQAFVKNKRFLGNEKTGLSTEANDILDMLNKTEEAAKDLIKTTKKQDEILKEQKAANDKRMKRLYEGRAYEGNEGMYRALAGYHLPKLHDAGIIKLDPKIYEAIKKGEYHHGGADFFAPDPNRVLQYHFGTKIFDDIDDVIQKTQHLNEVPFKGSNGMIDFLKKNDYLPFKKDGPKNSLDYMTDGEKLERVKELDEGTELIKKGDSPFFKTPDAIMGRVMENANDKKAYLESFKRTHPEKYKLYEKKQSTEPFFGVDIGQDDIFSDLAGITYPKKKADVIKMKPKPKEEAVENVLDLSGKKIDTSKPIIGGKNVELTHQEKIDWLVKNVSPTAEQTIPPKAALEAMLKDGREDLIDHFFEMHTKELGKPRIDIDTSDLKHPGLVKKMMEDEKLKPTLVKEKPGQGKFTKAEYLIQRLENTLKDPNADPYVRKTFPGFIDELKANPDLAKNENVFKELGGDLPKDQQIVVYDDDTLDFFRQTEFGPHNIEGVTRFHEKHPFLTREEAVKISKMEPNDQVMELTKLRHLSKKKTDNAEGGIIGYALGGQII